MTGFGLSTGEVGFVVAPGVGFDALVGRAVDGVTPGVPGVLLGSPVGVLAPEVGVLGVVGVLPPAAGFVSLPQATNSNPIVPSPAAVVRRACFHPRVDISPAFWVSRSL